MAMPAGVNATPGLIYDPALPHLRDALDPARVADIFASHGERHPMLHWPLIGVELVRHKPGRRAVIAYTLRNPANDGRCVLIGKMRRHRSGRSGYALLCDLQRSGFDEESADHISVPAPIAHIRSLHLVLQYKVAGAESTHLLAGTQGVELARRIAEAAYKIHCADIAPHRRHDMLDELRILHERLDEVAQRRPEWRRRLERLKLGATRLGTSLKPTGSYGIHRDFYADQIIIDGSRLWLLDFDLYCAGDPALDIGNFIGHVTEQSLRMYGDAAALLDVEQALLERYAELAGDDVRPAVGVYALLTLMRHIHLSTQHEDRRPYTGSLLALCERRVAAEPDDRVVQESRGT